MGHRIKVYPHNDLLTLAHYHREIVNRKVATNNEEALALDCMSCIIALAFSVEALINFVGSKKISGWKERNTFNAKIKALSGNIGLNFERTKEPYITVEKLKSLRDQMAHGQPLEDTKVVSSIEELTSALKVPWNSALTPSFANHSFAQVKVFKVHLLKLARIPLVDTLTSGVGSWTET
jgi:hypothetical protein